MRIGSLFTGYGGLDLAAETVFDAHTVWTVENDRAASKIIGARFPDIPNHGDITQVDWTTVEPVDILTGGFPCQDISLAGFRAGLHPGTRSGLWEHMVYAITHLRPEYVIAENVKGLLHADAASDVEPCPVCLGNGTGRHMRALGAVLGDLAGVGYDAQWVGLHASDVGACHRRFRVFLIATDTRRIPRNTRRSAPAGGTQGRESFGEFGRRHRNLLPTPDAGHDRKQTRTGPLLAGVAEHELTGYGDRFGPFADAVHRWEQITGITGPDPTIDGRLSPKFVEWMMGLEPGWVTGLGLSRSAQLRVLGNGVVPRQAVAALSHIINNPGR